jgi:hypothetical protein
MFVLAAQLHAPGDPALPWRRYREYLEQHKSRFPSSAYRLASGPLIDAADRRCPHDAWLEWARFEEPAKGKRLEIRHLSLRVRLLGAYHDRYIELFYPKVFSYSLANPGSGAGHFDWRYSELRLGEDGSVVHEIEWAGPPGAQARWIIEASDVRLRTVALERPDKPLRDGPLES